MAGVVDKLMPLPWIGSKATTDDNEWAAIAMTVMVSGRMVGWHDSLWDPTYVVQYDTSFRKT